MILGEQRTGKTSVYRQLVGKEFKQNQDSTKGIDNTQVETVDTRHVASDTWEEKSNDDQKQQSKTLFARGVVKHVQETLPASKEVRTTFPKHSKKELLDELEKIKKALLDIECKIEYIQERKFHQTSYNNQHSFNAVTMNVKVKPSASSKRVQFNVPGIAPTMMKVEKDAGREHGAEVHKIHGGENWKTTSVAGATTASATKVDSKPLKPKLTSHASEGVLKKKEIHSISQHDIQLSRGQSKQISRLMKGGFHGSKEIPLTYNALDFAGQKEYRPMHHCFITRRAVYLVVFNLKKMVMYIKEKKLNSESSPSENPLEQIRYWLHSIHAHIFPPNQGDHMRRVCLVGTHRGAPAELDEVTEELLKQINDVLKEALECDERCVSHLHYTAKPERIFVAVENSMDSKEKRKLSGILQLQSELKEISDNLPFLKEDHPIMWLNFEAQLVETCTARKKNGLSVVVPVQEVLQIASQNGIETEEDQRLALDFFHDTGKIVCLGQ